MAKKAPATKPVTGIQDAPAFIRKGAVTVPSLSVAKMVEGDSVYVRFESPIFDKADVDQKSKKQKIDPDSGEAVFLHIVRCTNLLTGELCELVLGHIVYRALHEYEGGYVGKCFELLKGEKKGRTNMWSVFEIDA